MTVLATSIIDLSTGESVAAAGLAVILDETLNRDSAGKVKSQFAPGDDIHLLVVLPENLRLVRASASAGTLSGGDLVTRQQVDQVLFEFAGKAVALSYRPQGYPVASWYGTRGSFVVDHQEASVAARPGSALPALADLSYDFTALAYTLRAPRVTLAEEETYPLAFVAYVEEVSQ